MANTKAKKKKPKAQEPKTTGTITATRRCGNDRPDAEVTKEEKGMRAKKLTLEDIGDYRMALTAFPGCIEGDWMTYSIKDEARNVFLHGTADQIALYTVGDEVAVKVAGEDAKFQREIGRKFEEPVSRIKDEMYGTGEVARLIKDQGGKHGGYTITVNGQKVKKNAILNRLFKKQKVMKDGEPVLRDNKPVEYFGGVELVVTAIIIPGSEQRENYQPLEKRF